MKKYVIVGTGIRGIYEYALPLVQELSDCADLCGVYDTNHKRAELVSKVTQKSIPVFASFDEMMQTVKPEVVIVTTVDSEHDQYIVKGLDYGCEVITEKPLTTDAEKLKTIYEAQKRSGKEVSVTFNLRFHPFLSRVKQMMLDGILGDVYNVHYEWKLDTKHGSSYFRRWHGQRKYSGSLLIHKSTHHFDLINWLIDQEPVKINAFGTRRFYGATREERSVRCLTCPYQKKCEFYYDLENDTRAKELYLDCEDVDGYYRDKCVFSEDIDIEDSVSVNVQYDKGAVMSYSLTAHSPFEGFRMFINGSKGRLEMTNEKRNDEEHFNVVFYNRFDEKIEYGFPEALLKQEGHCGADEKQRDMIFRGYTEDPLHQIAGLRAGAMSIGIGIAANESMRQDRAITIEELYKDIELY